MESANMNYTPGFQHNTEAPQSPFKVQAPQYHTQSIGLLCFQVCFHAPLYLDPATVQREILYLFLQYILVNAHFTH